jgi:hypothetical protein
VSLTLEVMAALATALLLAIAAATHRRGPRAATRVRSRRPRSVSAPLRARVSAPARTPSGARRRAGHGPGFVAETMRL